MDPESEAAGSDGRAPPQPDDTASAAVEKAQPSTSPAKMSPGAPALTAELLAASRSGAVVLRLEQVGKREARALQVRLNKLSYFIYRSRER